MTGMLRFENVSHAFGGDPVLEEVSVQVEAGRATAVIGPNGAGKTTLVRIGAGFVDPSEGDVFVGGQRLEDLSRRDAAKLISVLRQAPPQVFDFSTFELVVMGFHARTSRFALPSQSQRDRAMRAMEQLDIRHLADRPATTLSGGELQRALMARTMVAETDLWLLDEPTAHLDPRHEIALLRRVRKHVGDGGAALCALHNLALVQRFFDDVIVLKEGRIHAAGRIEETLHSELLSDVFDVEMRSGEVDGHRVWVPRSGH